jgi:hypothetical protein
MKFLSLTVVFLVLGVVHGYHNVTVDDTSSSIAYTGVWMPLSDETNALDYGGSHHVSQQQGSTATFSFTGTVIKQLFSNLALSFLFIPRCRVLLHGSVMALRRHNRNHPRWIPHYG